MIGTVWCAQQESYSPSPMGVHCSRELEPRAPTHRCPIHPGIAMARLLAGNPSRCSTLNLPRSSAAMKVPSAAPSWMMCSRPNGLTSFHGGPVGTIGRGRWRRSKGVVDMSVTVIGPGMNSKPSSTHAERSGSASLRHHSRRYRSFGKGCREKPAPTPMPIFFTWGGWRAGWLVGGGVCQPTTAHACSGRSCAGDERCPANRCRSYRRWTR